MVDVMMKIFETLNVILCCHDSAHLFLFCPKKYKFENKSKRLRRPFRQRVMSWI